MVYEAVLIARIRDYLCCVCVCVFVYVCAYVRACVFYVQWKNSELCRIRWIGIIFYKNPYLWVCWSSNRRILWLRTASNRCSCKSKFHFIPLRLFYALNKCCCCCSFPHRFFQMCFSIINTHIFDGRPCRYFCFLSQCIKTFFLAFSFSSDNVQDRKDETSKKLKNIAIKKKL